MQSKLRMMLAISVILKAAGAPHKLMLTCSFGQQKSQHRLSRNHNFVNTHRRKLGVNSNSPSSDCKTKGEIEMSKKQNPTTRSIKMRKPALLLILVMALASCSSFAQNPQSPAPAPTDSATQAPAAEVAAYWKTYMNAEVGFSIQ